ncbi:hypothetical protein I5M32_05770 [Pedobacter sp. SD-b]|uniref:ATP-GRASP peptide maturase, grasp-with-spasm system n=1 Tax=Pedobacter segetis TaxID=2793069 RepID=A0ABS1BJS0_9SPHI|nr:hypothetical protein [Pedobacter segetis]MBK0382464.1 hypothetical protein [Pedobacter segetis]
MILIISEPGDYSANCVIEWLKNFECNFLRIDISYEDFKQIEINISKFICEISIKLKKGKLLNLNEVSFIFYRSGVFKKPLKHYNNSLLPQSSFRLHHNLEYKTLTDFFYNECSKKSIGYLSSSPLNKLLQLQVAFEVGLSIPNTKVCSLKSSLHRFQNGQHLLNKGIQENIIYQSANSTYFQRVTEIDYHQLSEQFYSSMFQYQINKKFEVRSFFLDSAFYSIAIFDCFNPLKTDYRDGYDIQSYCPFQLPHSIETKLRNLMKKLRLISGSIDLICNEYNEFFFLEVNTQGQYDWVLKYGNYNLHKKIAEFLYEKEKYHK